MKKVIFALSTMLLFWNVNQCTTEKSVRGSKGFGFFSDFLWTLNHLEYCKRYDKKPVIYWGPDFAYYDSKGFNDSFNGWEYYFEPVSNANFEPTDQLRTDIYYDTDFSTIWAYHQYIQHISLCRTEEKKCFKRVTTDIIPWGPPTPIPRNMHLYSRNFRSYVKTQLIDPYVRLKPNIKNHVDTFYKQHMHNHIVIGVHLRGKHTFGEVPVVPVSTILQEANKIAQKFKQARFFVATDQLPLLKQAKETLKGQVLHIECERFTQTTSPIPGKKLHPQLGADVLVETLLLSQCNFFVHTISLVSTAALYFNPYLPHIVLY